MTIRAVVLFLFAGLAFASAQPGEGLKAKRPREALQPFNDLVGDQWRATVTPAGAKDDPRKFWTEQVAWEWQFKGKDAWLKLDVEKGKHFTAGELRYLPEKDQFALTVTTADNKKLTFSGPLKAKVLTLDREESGELHRLVFTLLHSNRYLYRYEVRPADKTLFKRQYAAGVTNDRVPFAGGDGRPECVVSGGVGTMPVTYMGKTYYVCCSGCRDEFRENPEKYVREFEAKKSGKPK